MLTARTSWESKEANVLRYLGTSSSHPGASFIPKLLDEFSVTGPNGTHLCLITEPMGPNIAASKEQADDYMFPLESTRSIAAQLILGLSHLHSKGVCHGDLYMLNILLSLRMTGYHELTVEELYKHFREPDCTPISRRDGLPVSPYAPRQAARPLYVNMPASDVIDPQVSIADYGTSFLVAEDEAPRLHTFPHYRPPESFFSEPITLAADVWTLGVNLYNIMGERPLFEVFGCNQDDIICEMVSTLGILPARWWDQWPERSKFFNADGSWANDYQGLADPISRPLPQRLWEMGRGETPETCSWDVAGGEMQALEEMFRGMLMFEPSQRWTAEHLLHSEYMTRWALPAWKKQLERTKHVD